MRYLVRTTIIVLLLLGVTGTAMAGEGPTILVDGSPRDAPALRAMAEAAQRAVELARAAPGSEKTLIDAMVAEAEALQRAATLIETIHAVPDALVAASEGVARANEAVQQAETAAALEIALDEVDEKGIAEFEAQARQRAAAAEAAAEAAAALSAQVETRKAAMAQAPERDERLKTRAAQLQAALAEAAEDAAAQREQLVRLLRTNEVRRGVATLEDAHHTALLEVDTLRRDAARTAASAEAKRGALAAATLTRARSAYESRLAVEAARQEEETRRKLREAELAASPAVSAITLLEALVVRMQGEFTSERRRLSELKTLRREETLLAQNSATRLEAAQALFPAGAALESWQRETLTEYLRQLDRDVETDRLLRTGRIPSMVTVRAHTITDRGRLDVFRQRLEAVQDRTDLQEDEDLVARLEEELRYSQWEDVRLWIQARLDFIRGQTELRPDEVGQLRVRWQETTTQLKKVVEDRSEHLRQTESVVTELGEALGLLRQSLADRRAHLDRIAFWTRSTPLLSGAYLSAVGDDVRALGRGLAAAPAHVADLQERASATPNSGYLAAALLAFILFAVGLRVWLGRRVGRLNCVARPVGELDALQRVERAAALLLQAVILPLLLLGAAVWLRQRAPDEIVAVIAVALPVIWLGFALARGVSVAFFTADAAGRNLAGCTEQTARAARRVSVLALGATTLWLGTALVLNHAGLVQLREVLGLILGIGGIVLGVWLWVRRDVLLSLVPRDTGSLLARTSRSLLRFGWPLGVLLWAANIVLNALGYRTASSFFAQRALLLLAALLLLGLLHAMARAWLLRHAPQEAESGFDDSSDRATSRHAIGNRLLWQLLGIGSLVGVIGVTSAVFEIGSDDWRALGAWSLTGGAAGTGITLGRLFKGIVILVVTAMIARHARDLMRVFLRSRSRIEQGTRYAVRTLLFYVIIVVGSVAALAALGLDMTQFGWFLTAAGVGIGFGLQEIFSNLISGLILFFERPVQVGDVVTVGDVQGDVQQINLRSTVIRTGDGVSIILPNKRLITDDVINWSHGQKRTRLQIEVGVAYGSDTELVRRVLLQCASSNERVMRRPVPDVEFRSFGDSQLTFILYCWLPSPDITLRRRARSEMNTAIDTAFAANGITIPFPQRDVHVKREPRTEA